MNNAEEFARYIRRYGGRVFANLGRLNSYSDSASVFDVSPDETRSVGDSTCFVCITTDLSRSNLLKQKGLPASENLHKIYAVSRLSASILIDFGNVNLSLKREDWD